MLIFGKCISASGNTFPAKEYSLWKSESAAVLSVKMTCFGVLWGFLLEAERILSK